MRTSCAQISTKERLMSKKEEAYQRLFNTFLDRVDGHGRCVNDEGVCQYVVDGKPGCAIGCQPPIADDPDMREKVSRFESSGLIGVRTLLANIEELGPALFGREPNQNDLLFATALQSFHDSSGNWRGGLLLPGAVRVFAREHWLAVPPKYLS